jgi:hypothetical protein
MKKLLFAVILVCFEISNAWSQCACCAGVGISLSNGGYNKDKDRIS